MSAGGTNTRAGMVDSWRCSCSRFFWTWSSCFAAMVALRFLVTMTSIDPDGARLVALRARQEQRQDAVAVLRLDGVGVDLHRHGERAVELAGAALAPVHAHAFRIRDGLAA